MADYTDRLCAALREAGVDAVRVGTDGHWLRQAAGCDILHLQYPAVGFGWSLLPHVAPLAARMPVLVTLHEFSRTNSLRRASSALFSLGLHRVAFTTAEERDAFSRAFRWWPGTGEILPIGSNIPFLANHPSPHPTVVYFGHIKPGRGLEEFLAVARLAAGGRGYRFKVLGSVLPGRELYAGELQADTTGLGVDWLVDLDAESVAEHLSTATVAYLPFPDGASLRRSTLLAALGNGAPVITTDGPLCPPGLRDAVRFAHAPAEALRAIDALVSDPAAGASLSAAGRAFADAYAWPKVAEAHVKAYRACMPEPAPPPRPHPHAPTGR